MNKAIDRIKAGSEHHIALTKFSKSLADRLGISSIAVMGQLLKLDEKMIEAMNSEKGMSALVIETNIEPTAGS